jgi:hypothetical protein
MYWRRETIIRDKCVFILLFYWFYVKENEPSMKLSLKNSLMKPNDSPYLNEE